MASSQADRSTVGNASLLAMVCSELFGLRDSSGTQKGSRHGKNTIL